jgi:deoxyribodipyrimidine photolyase
MNDGMLSVSLKKEGGKLVHVHSGEQAQYAEFVKNLKDGQVVDVFFEVANNDKSRDQQNKVYKCIRTLAMESGMSFEDMKLHIKGKAGMKKADGTYKSFGNCSKEEMSLAIQACIDLGDFLNVNLR